MCEPPPVPHDRPFGRMSIRTCPPNAMPRRPLQRHGIGGRGAPRAGGRRYQPVVAETRAWWWAARRPRHPRLHGLGAPPPIVPHPRLDVQINKDRDDDDARADKVSRRPAKRQPSPAPVRPEVTVMAHVLVSIAPDESKRCHQGGQQVKDQVGEPSVQVQPRSRAQDKHGRVKGDQQDGNIRGLGCDGEGKAAELAKDGVRLDVSPRKAGNCKDEEG